MQLHYRLSFDEAGLARLYVFRNCRHFIRTLPLLQYDKSSPEDLDTQGEDHAADEARYFCMARPLHPGSGRKSEKRAALRCFWILKKKIRSQEDREWRSSMKQAMQIGPEQVRAARVILNRCREGKANLERRVIEDEQWYRMRHWECMRRGAGSTVEPASGWLFNAIANKHAEAMDNFPRPNVLPREEGDKELAKVLGSILPVILQQEDFEDTYDRVMDDKLKTGTGIYGVFWNPDKLDGLGDISIHRIDVLNLYWESGITDIQQSRNVFYLRLWDNDLLLEQYPQLEGKLGAQETGNRYVFEDRVDTSEKTAVIDWYYKKRQGSKTVLHYCKFVGDTVLFATENEARYRDRGWYDHGLYPFVFDPLFRTAGSPCGFGYIDVGKSAQEYVDRGNQAILQNMLSNAGPGTSSGRTGR